MREFSYDVGFENLACLLEMLVKVKVCSPVIGYHHYSASFVNENSGVVRECNGNPRQAVSDTSQ